MPEYIELNETEKKQLHILQTFQRKKREFLLHTNNKKSTIRITSAISPLLDENRKEDALLLSRYSDCNSIAYRRLSILPGSIRFCEARISNALRILEEDFYD